MKKDAIMDQNDKKLPFLGKVIWITGASAGIGEELSYQLSQLGASLILSGRNEDRLKHVNENLPRNPGEAKLLPFDLANLDQLPQQVDTALSFHGRVDCLINNAALAIRDYALATDLKVDKKLMDINYFGPMILTKQLLPHMLEKRSGQLVVVSSLSGKFGVPRTAAYAASKHALHGFFESLRSETVNSGVSITVIVPGIINTQITAHAVVGDGSNFGRWETTFQNGYPVEKATRKMIKAILHKKGEVFVGGAEGATLWLTKISPQMVHWILRNHPIRRWRWFKQRFLFTEKNSL
jgi:short-subunit dehydrogenase